jgi:hypothetical protein
MAETYTIPGPCRIHVGTGVAPNADEATIKALDALGFAADDDLFRVSLEYLNNPIQSSDTGQENSEYVYAGLTATISGTLAKWDPAVTTEFLQAPGSTVNVSQGVGAGVIGTPLIVDDTTSRAISIGIVPLASGKDLYFFPRCYFDGQFEIFDMGNVNMKATFSVTAFRVGSTADAVDALPDGTDTSSVVYRKLTTT